MSFGEIDAVFYSYSRKTLDFSGLNQACERMGLSGTGGKNRRRCGNTRKSRNRNDEVFCRSLLRQLSHAIRQFTHSWIPVMGLAVALLGIFLSQSLNQPYFDGGASIVIGLLLCTIAIVMVHESRGLLIGEGVDHKTLKNLRVIVEADEDVAHVQHLHTIYQSPRSVLLVIELRFHDSISAVDVRKAVRRLEANIQARYPEIKYVFFGAESITSESS